MTAVDKDARAASEGIPGQIAPDFNLIGFLKEEVDKSGELNLKVALWKVMLRLPQHFALEAGARDEMKRVLVGLIAQSEELIAEGASRGGLDQNRHGVSEQVVRENIEWLREKLVLLDLELTDARKSAILSAFE